MLYLRKTCETWLLLTVIIFLQLMGSYAAEDKSASDSKQSLDYDYNDEDDTSAGSSHGDGKLAQPKSTLMPYFEHNTTTVYLTGDQDKLQLQCHPKNFDEKHHLILWYKDGHAITNGNITLSSDYELDNNYSLTILNYHKKTLPDNLGNYSCEILPHLIRQYVLIRTEADAPDNLLNMDNGALSFANNNLLVRFFQQFYYSLVILSILNVGLNSLVDKWLFY